MNNLNQQVKLQKPANPFKFILIVVALIFIIFVISFTIKSIKISKQINKVEANEIKEVIELKQYLKANYTPEQQKLIEGQNNYSLGSNTPLVTIVEFSDFACSYCRDSYFTMRELSIEYEDDIKIIFRDRPGFKNSTTLSMTAYCAGEQGKFWAMHDKLFQYQSPNLGSNTADLITLAKQIGLDTDQFIECMKDDKYLEQIRNNFLAAEELNVVGTPTWFINGEKVEGNIDKQDWKTTIEKLIK